MLDEALNMLKQLKAGDEVPNDEIQEMIDDGKEIEMTCRFCDKKYIFTVDELTEIRDRHYEQSE